MTDSKFPPQQTLEVANSCLCLYTQRAARALARHFDEAFRPLELTNGQFSLLMSLNRPEAPTVRETADFLAMDRTTLTALLKPLERRKLVANALDEKDRRKRRLRLTAAGHALLLEAYPIWQQTHAELETLVNDAQALRHGLKVLVFGSMQTSVKRHYVDLAFASGQPREGGDPASLRFPPSRE